ncbi:hypothetical protein ACROYT_G038625 [Oculina patagonica]
MVHSSGDICEFPTRKMHLKTQSPSDSDLCRPKRYPSKVKKNTTGQQLSGYAKVDVLLSATKASRNVEESVVSLFQGFVTLKKKC